MPVEIIVLARRDRKRSATLARRSPATYFCGPLRRFASALISWIFQPRFL